MSLSPAQQGASPRVKEIREPKMFCNGHDSEAERRQSEIFIFDVGSEPNDQRTHSFTTFTYALPTRPWPLTPLIKIHYLKVCNQRRQYQEYNYFTRQNEASTIQLIYRAEELPAVRPEHMVLYSWLCAAQDRVNET